MAHANPLLVLGIPRSVLVYEKAYGSPARILKTAEQIVKTLSRFYHPDVLGEDVQLMQSFGSALEEIRDLEALEFYLDEIVGASETDALRMQKQALQFAELRNEAVSAMAGGYGFINQFEVACIESPLTLICSGYLQTVVVDILSRDETRARITTASPEVDLDITPPFATGQVSFKKGVWYQTYNFDDELREFPLRRFKVAEQVRVAGFVAKTTTAPPSDESGRVSVETGDWIASFDWQAPEDCWFLPELYYPDRPPQVGDGVVLYKDGQFTFAGTVLGTAEIKTTT